MTPHQEHPHQQHRHRLQQGLYCRFFYQRRSFVFSLLAFLVSCYNFHRRVLLAVVVIQQEQRGEQRNRKYPSLLNNQRHRRDDDQEQQFALKRRTRRNSLSRLQNDLNRTNDRTNQQQQQQQQQQQSTQQQQQQFSSSSSSSSSFPPYYYKKILYVMTSVAEFDNGKRETVAGFDRFSNTILPVARQSVNSMVSAGYAVDFYFICHYNLTGARYRELRAALPAAAGVRVWDDATPLGYSTTTQYSTARITEIKTALSRQHRFVVKDWWNVYDVFVCFEDDMVLSSHHVTQYTAESNTIHHLKRAAAAYTVPPEWSIHDMPYRYYGPMTVEQLSRMVPGFIRVEAALSGFHSDRKFSKLRRENVFDQVPVDYAWKDEPSSSLLLTENQKQQQQQQQQQQQHDDDEQRESHLNAAICCHMDKENARDHIPAFPGPDDLYFWETSIDALGVRKMPTLPPPPSWPPMTTPPLPYRQEKQQSSSNAGQAAAGAFWDNNSSYSTTTTQLDWVLLQAGNTDQWYADTKFVIGDYWTGRDGLLGPKYNDSSRRPVRTKGRYLNNQGGWMATRRQIASWHSRWCRGGFLPPYGPPAYKHDGLDTQTVEYWSGGIQIAGVMSCNLQRYIPLSPDHFSRHLLYHASNNKQKQKNLRYRFSTHSIDAFWGQLNTVKKRAEQNMLREKQQQQQQQQNQEAF